MKFIFNKHRLFRILFIALVMGLVLHFTHGENFESKSKEMIQSVGNYSDSQTDHSKEEHSGHADPVADVILGLAIILFTAKLGGYLFEKIKQPAVLGELVFGVLIGNMHLILNLFGIENFDFFHKLFFEHPDSSGQFKSYIEILAGLGVIILLFKVGLESTVREMKKVGIPSLLVAIIGVALPFILGYKISDFLNPQASFYIHLFIGATLTATSVGITARVFQDLSLIKSKEAKIILGAAVIDDVLGLVILAVVTGIIEAANATGTASVNITEVIKICVLAFGFLFLSLFLGVYLGPWLVNQANRIKVDGMKLTVALLFCFVFSWAANSIGLATIVGAFAAGLILEEVHFEKYGRQVSLEEWIEPIELTFVPIFFVIMGVGAKLETFGNTEVLGAAAALTVIAILSKQAASLGVLGIKDVNFWSIGVGMIPRGEVGLIFASIGKSLTINGKPVISDELYSAVVIMVIVTTMFTPPLLKLILKEKS